MLLPFRYESHLRQIYPDEEDFSTQETIDAHLLEETILQLIEFFPFFLFHLFIVAGKILSLYVISKNLD
ncbi:MAG: hypothetical protein LBP83_07415 [Dysgonamonadaceae bacterium]|jgi:hypothetical protein|nr:hypothetical protein [Dysgonamonadaceae bacterium]